MILVMTSEYPEGRKVGNHIRVQPWVLRYSNANLPPEKAYTAPEDYLWNVLANLPREMG